MLLETHSAFCSSRMCLRLNELLDDPMLVLWDAHHTWRSARETPGETWEALGPLVRHLHFSDSRLRAPEPSYECVLPGTGEYPVAALAAVLAKCQDSPSVSLEWEKLWHPELPDIRRALDLFARQL
jgi:sugar phosphate isomerase/epimerase